jgi:hypothetical protein
MHHGLTARPLETTTITVGGPPIVDGAPQRVVTSIDEPPASVLNLGIYPT